MLSNRWAKALSVGVLVLLALAIVIFVTSVFSRGERTMTRGQHAGQCSKHDQGGCQGMGMMGRDGGRHIAQESMESDQMMAYAAPSVAAMPELMPMMGKSMPGMMGGSVVSVERTVSSTASLDMRAKSLDWTVAKIRDIAKNVGGFVENANVTQPEWGMRSAWMTVKVPADRFDTALAEIKQSADQVVNEHMGATDMTAQSIDLSARLNNKRAEEKSYENLLSSATKVSDVVEVTQYLTNVRTEIESLEQQMRYLEGQTALATLSVTVTEDPQVGANPGEFKRGNVFKNALNTLVDALVALGSGLVEFLIAGLPILLIIFGLLWVVYRVAKRAVDRLFGR